MGNELRRKPPIGFGLARRLLRIQRTEHHHKRVPCEAARIDLAALAASQFDVRYAELEMRGGHGGIIVRGAVLHIPYYPLGGLRRRQDDRDAARAMLRRVRERLGVGSKEAAKPVRRRELEMPLARLTAGRDPRGFIFLKGAPKVVGSVVQAHLLINAEAAPKRITYCSASELIRRLRAPFQAMKDGASLR